MNLVIIFSYLLEIEFGWYIDGYMGAFVALIIIYGGITSIIETSNDLLGTGPDSQLVTDMQEVLDSYQSLVGYHDLILHKYGPNKMFATVDVDVDARWDLIEAHRVIDSIEKEFDERFGIKLVGHLDPVELNDDEQNEVYANVKRTLKSYKEDFYFHDLRLEDEKVIFDITVPDNIQMSDEELYQIIVKDLSKDLQDYEIRIHFDRNYFLKE